MFCTQNHRAYHGIARREMLLATLSMPFLAAAASAKSDPRAWPLWIIEAGGAEVYILGETPPLKTDWSNPHIESIAAGCDEIWTETNHTSRGNLKDLLAHYGVATTPLAKRLEPADYARVIEAAKLCKVPVDTLAQFRPWLVAQSLEETAYAAEGRKGHAAQNIITEAAGRAGKKIQSEFPAADDVVQWFGAMTPQQDVEYLRYTLDQILVPEADEIAKFDAWNRGNAAPATDWILRLRKIYPELYPYIVVARNRGWIARVQSILASGKKGFAIVGLYHLVGPDSIQTQLELAGLHIRRAS